VLSFFALILLTKKAYTYNTVLHRSSFVIFGLSLLLLYIASTIYHYTQRPKLRKIYNVLDHASIYILIAGTYTPFTLVTLDNHLGWIIFGACWGITVVGIIFKLFFTGRFDKLSLASYISMGWIIIFAIQPLFEKLHLWGIFWLALGGLSYTIGAVFYKYSKIEFNHAIFHVFVLLGSLCHFISVYFYI